MDHENKKGGTIENIVIGGDTIDVSKGGRLPSMVSGTLRKTGGKWFFAGVLLEVKDADDEAHLQAVLAKGEKLTGYIL